jgi:membrane associated rhomboid family serine protease
MFFALPLRVEETAERQSVPLTNGLLIAINVMVFWLGWSPSWMVGPGTGLLSVLTYSFSHANAWHLIANMWLLMVFGNPVNRRLGNLYYLFSYFGSVVTLGVFARLLASGYLLGSSGAIYAVIAICLMLMPARKVEIFYIALFPITLLAGLLRKPQAWVAWFLRWDRFELHAYWAMILVPLMELAGLVWWGWNWTNLAHLFGLLCGMAAVLMLPTEITLNRRRAAWQPS